MERETLTYHLVPAALGDHWVGSSADFRNFVRQLKMQARALDLAVHVRASTGSNTAAAADVWKKGRGAAAWSAACDVTFRSWAIDGVPYPDPGVELSDQQTAFCGKCGTLARTESMNFDDEGQRWLCPDCDEPTTSQLNGLPDEDNSGWLP